MAQALALKYRPKSFEDLTEQTAVVTILKNQIVTNTIKHGYLFVGAAGTGKTTSARIFASMINNGSGTPIELDAASNNSVDDIRTLIEQAQTKALDAEYKVFIIDECHMITPQGWNAFLKTLEEPPLKSILIMCTTNPEKIPATILSRCQRYDFQRISQDGIYKRLLYIMKNEFPAKGNDVGTVCEKEALEYITKVADGGMRDAITMLDKCLSYSKEITVENVVKALGVADYSTMQNLVSNILSNKKPEMIELIENVHASGIDLKQFLKTFTEFILDMNIYGLTKNKDLVKIPYMYLKDINKSELDCLTVLLDRLVHLNIKYEHNPKPIIVAHLLLFMEEYHDRPKTK